ncbi:MAG: PliI family lysozyme inhibitor of I-type lysozyme [Proteobacteria bacterium]|nr:PliI family lysozyme inhibitor of I-type lysozyme [Pseudomonadota bacterium]
MAAHTIAPHLTAVVLLLAGLGAARADTVDALCDISPKGSDQVSKVVPCTFSQRQGHVAIDRADGVRHELSPKGAPGNYVDENGQAAVRNKGLGNKGQIYRLSKESVFVYWDTAGLPGSGQAKAGGAKLEPTKPTVLPAAAPLQVPFDQTLKLQGVSFRITSPNSSSINELKIVPSGLKGSNATIVRSIEGQITRAEVADLNVDGSPEVYVFVRSAGSGSYGTLVAYSANNRKSLSEIYLPPITDDPKSAQGYMGHDEFAVIENTLARRFPVYKDGDINAAPSGGVRQLQYKLRPGEAGWVLKVDRVVAY